MSNYFLACSCRLKGSPNRYFLGLVTCEKKRTFFDVKIVEKREMYFSNQRLQRSKSWSNSLNIALMPNKIALRELHKAFKAYFKGKNALITWTAKRIKDSNPYVDIANIDHFEIIEGVIDE